MLQKHNDNSIKTEDLIYSLILLCICADMYIVYSIYTPHAAYANTEFSTILQS